MILIAKTSALSRLDFIKMNNKMKKETNYFLTLVLICISGISAVLSHANEIDGINPSATENNAPQTQGIDIRGINKSSGDCNSHQLTKNTGKNMSWKQMDKYYLSNGTSTITKISIGEKVVYELWWKQKQYSQFDTSDQAKQRFNELESQA